jgi:hypothetical protein
MLAPNLSLLSGEKTLTCSEGLGFNDCYIQSPCNPLAEDYAEVFK